MWIGSDGIEWNVFERRRAVACAGGLWAVTGGELEITGSMSVAPLWNEGVRWVLGRLGREGKGELEDMGSRNI